MVLHMRNVHLPLCVNCATIDPDYSYMFGWTVSLAWRILNVRDTSSVGLLPTEEQLIVTILTVLYFKLNSWYLNPDTLCKFSFINQHS